MISVTTLKTVSDLNFALILPREKPQLMVFLAHVGIKLEMFLKLNAEEGEQHFYCFHRC